MTYILPAILEHDLNGFENRVFDVTRIDGVSKIQIDFCDGIFVEAKTVSVADIELLNPAFFWEAHLMIKNPKQFLDYKLAGFGKIIVHFEAFENKIELLKAVDDIKDLGLIPAIAINPGTDPGVLLEYVHELKDITVMSVIPGRQGAKFEPQSLEVLRFLKQKAPSFVLEADGSVNLDTIGMIYEAGADTVVAGSAIFAQGDIQENYDKLMREVIWKND